jgi:acetyl esterase
MQISPRQRVFDRDVAAFLALFRASNRPRFDQMTVAAARIAYRAGQETTQLVPIPLAEVVDRAITGRPVRIYRPEATVNLVAAPAILFLHGGGWVIGDLDTHDGICRMLAAASCRTLVALDYRLAPEHKLPAAYEDTIAAYTALVRDADLFRIELADIAVAGDSAGGAMAAMLALVAPALGLPKPSKAALFYPLTDLLAAPSYRKLDNVPITGETIHWFLDHALPAGSDAVATRCSPLRASSLSGFPPVFLTSAGHDPLCDEAFLFADRLREAGVRVQHRHLAGNIHGYLTLGRLIAEAECSITAAGAFLLHRRLPQSEIGMSRRS